MNHYTSPITLLVEPADLRPMQLAWLAVAVFIVSAGYGALLPLLPACPTVLLFLFNAPATTEIYTLSLHDALPIRGSPGPARWRQSRSPCR